MLQPSPEQVDATYLNAMQQHFKEVLRKARHNVSFFRTEIEALTTQEALPPPYREAYGQIVAALVHIEQIISEEKELAFPKNLLRPAALALQAPPPALVAAAQQTIEQINAAEHRLIEVIESAQKALLEHAEQGLIDWTMPFEYEFTILLDPGDVRTFYATCAEGEEPLRLYLGRHTYIPYEPEEGNWNIFRNEEGHPLHEGHHDLLVHCLLYRMKLPWQLLPFIKEVEVEVKFHDFEGAWERPPQGSSS